MRAAWICGVTLLVIGCETGPGGNVGFAITRAKDIAVKVEAFRLTQGRYPASIEDLIKEKPDGSQPLLPDEAVRDPWGKTFQLKIEKDANGVERVEVFTLGPRGQRISNLTGAG